MNEYKNKIKLWECYEGKYPISQRFGDHFYNKEGKCVYREMGLNGHNGVDFALPVGTKLIAVSDGKVAEIISERKGYGNHIRLYCSQGNIRFEVLYAHCNKFLVKQEGETISKGQFIAESGNSGLSTGPHLHFGLRVLNEQGNILNHNNGYKGSIDPLKLFDLSKSNTPIGPGETKKEKLDKLNNHFENFIDKMIIKDIKKLEENNSSHKSSYPYLTLAFSGIDFFGGLVKGFARNNSRERFIWFLDEWMGKINILYKEESLGALLYGAARCGIFHNAALKAGFNISSHLYPEGKHLHYIKSSELIFLHSIRFAQDFIEAQKKFREDLNSSVNEGYINDVFENLKEMIDKNIEDNEGHLRQLIETLKDKYLIINDVSTSTSQSSGDSAGETPLTTPPPQL